MRRIATAFLFCILTVAAAFADCPPGTWSRNQYKGPGGGLNTGPGGGQYTGPGGGMSTDPGGGMYAGPGGGMSTDPGGGMYTGPAGGMSKDPGGGLYAGPGGGLYKGPGGGLYNGPGGGLYNGPGAFYCTKRPPWAVVLKALRNNGDSELANQISHDIGDAQ